MTSDCRVTIFNWLKQRMKLCLLNAFVLAKIDKTNVIIITDNLLCNIVNILQRLLHSFFLFYFFFLF